MLIAAVLMQRVFDRGEEQIRAGEKHDSKQLAAGLAK
jgi:hypothetical protein